MHVNMNGTQKYLRNQTYISNIYMSPLCGFNYVLWFGRFHFLVCDYVIYSSLLKGSMTMVLLLDVMKNERNGNWLVYIAARLQV